MPQSPFSYFVFVDFENVPGVDVGAAAPHPVHVTILIGKQQKSFNLPMVHAARLLGTRLDLVEVGASGRNALDLTLSYYLGRAVCENPDAAFAVVSKDKDFDPMIAHLKAKGVQVTRHPTFAALPFLTPAKPTPSRRAAAPARIPAARGPAPTRAPARPANDLPWERITAHLGNPHVQRPTTRARLLGFIKNRLGHDGTEGEALALLDRLQVEKRLTISKQGKVSYA